VDVLTSRVRVGFDYADESDPGPYPIPTSSIGSPGADLEVVETNTLRNGG
jgi:hypothetical protein